jgi:hypothetical protein
MRSPMNFAAFERLSRAFVPPAQQRSLPYPPEWKGRREAVVFPFRWPAATACVACLRISHAPLRAALSRLGQ